MRRRDFIKTLVGSAVLWPTAAYAQQSVMPLVGFLSGRSLASDSNLVKVFSQALSEAGYVSGQNVAIESTPGIGGRTDRAQSHRYLRRCRRCRSRRLTSGGRDRAGSL